jgi:hypothetical protein
MEEKKLIKCIDCHQEKNQEDFAPSNIKKTFFRM